LNSNNFPLSGGNVRVPGNKTVAQSRYERVPIVSNLSTPHFNLQLFDDSDGFPSEDNVNEIANERRALNLPKQPLNNDIDDDDEEDDDDDDDDIGHSSNLGRSRYRSQSLDDLSEKTGSQVRKRSVAARDVTTRRRALDPGDVHNLRSYVRHRKDSIVQRVIGYNYDDHSTAGGLYIRVGIGSKY